MSIREKIFNTPDVPEEQVAVPEWDVKLTVKGMTGLERSKFLKEVTDENGQPNFEKLYPALVISSCYDVETGARVFEDGDVDALNSKSGRVLETLASVALRLSGLDEGAADRLGKLSSSTASGDSTSS